MDLINDPSVLLHRLDMTAERATFVSADRGLLRSCAFHDGREPFWTISPVELPLAHVVEAQSSVGFGDRFIVNTGFCGSTLLARLLDQPGRSLVLREPQALTDAAAYYGLLQQTGIDDIRFRAILDRVRNALFRPRWDKREITVVKPSCWANNLLPFLGADPNARLLILTTDRYSFLRSVFRGGSARLSFAARLAVHLSGASTRWAQRVAAALATPGDQLDVIARLAAIVHRIQTEQFTALCAAQRCFAQGRMTLGELEADPAGAAARAAAILGLPPGPVLTAKWSRNHAKAAGEPFSADVHARANHATDRQYGPTIIRALNWEESSI